jgi:hypothetical protein
MYQKSPFPDGQITPLRRYRATVIPSNIRLDEAELKAEQGALPFVQFRAANASKAAAIAGHVTGLPVLKVERFEVAA